MLVFPHLNQFFGLTELRLNRSLEGLSLYRDGCGTETGFVSWMGSVYYESEDWMSSHFIIYIRQYSVTTDKNVVGILSLFREYRTS